MQQIPGPSIDFERAERAIHALPVFVVCAGKIGTRPQGGALIHGHQSIGCVIRQRLQQGRIHKPEDGHAYAHAQREDEDGRERESGILAQLAQRIAQVLQDGLRAESNEFAALLAEAAGLPKHTAALWRAASGAIPAATSSLSICARWKAISSSSSLRNRLRPNSEPELVEENREPVHCDLREMSNQLRTFLIPLAARSPDPLSSRAAPGYSRPAAPPRSPCRPPMQRSPDRTC